MDRAFSTAEEAEAFVRETLEEAAHPIHDLEPIWMDEVITDLPDIHSDMYEFVKEWVRGIESLGIGEVSALEHMVMWRDAVWTLGPTTVAQIASECLRPSPEAELEMLIRNVGMGYHPDTPYDGYEPPITAYTRKEWDAVHDRFYNDKEDDGRDIYEFGLDVFNQMEMESKPANGAHREVNGVHMYWAESLHRWVTIPQEEG